MAGGREIDVVECEAEENRRPFSLGSSLLGSSLGSSTRGSRSLSLSRLQLAYSSSQSPSPSRSLAKRFWRRKSPSIDDPETPTTETDSHYDDIGSPSSACAPSPHTRMLFSVVEVRGFFFFPQGICSADNHVFLANPFSGGYRQMS